MSKTYGFVDESGLTSDRLFIVGGVLLPDADIGRQAAQQLEEQTGKYNKWAKTREATRMAYLDRLLFGNDPIGVFACSIFRSPGTYQPRLIDGIAALLRVYQPDQKVIVYIDALTPAHRDSIAVGLRAVGLRVYDVRPSTDDKDPLIRVADAVVGLARDAQDKSEYKLIFERAIQKKRLQSFELE